MSKGQKSSNDDLQKVFKALDKDGSGFLSLVELKEILQQGNRHVTDTQINEVFEFFTSGDGDKKISFEEFQTGLKKLDEFKVEAVELFHKYDADKSGFLDKNELKKILHETGQTFSDAEIDDILKSIDPSGDNKISCDEFISAIS